MADKLPNNVSDTKKFTEKYYSFLVTDFGFENPKEKWVSYEFHIQYHKDSIEINVAIEADGASIPWVTLTHHGRPNDLDMTITRGNYYYIESLEDNQTLKELYKRRTERYVPKVEKFVKEFVRKDNHDHSELNNDYESLGQTELETVLRENADIIKRHAQILTGDLSLFPEREQPKELKVEIYDLTKKGAVKIKTERFKTIRDFLDFAKWRNKK